jgi:uncharacterized membrane protein
MAIRLQQMHPALVHLPVALLPLAVGADLLGRATGNQALLSFGQKAICVAAIGALGAVASGLIAGEEVNVEGESREMLITHRNLNLVATLAATAMAIWRASHRRPSTLYLGAGAAGIGIVAYTAYLGGKLVYDTGVGVEPAHGVYRADAPSLQAGQVRAFVKTAATDLVHGVQHMAQEVRKGQVVPTLVAAYRKRHATVQLDKPAMPEPPHAPSTAYPS